MSPRAGLQPHLAPAGAQGDDAGVGGLSGAAAGGWVTMALPLLCFSCFDFIRVVLIAILDLVPEISDGKLKSSDLLPLFFVFVFMPSPSEANRLLRLGVVGSLSESDRPRGFAE